MPKSLKTATKKAIHEGKVKQLDSLGSNQDEFDTKLDAIETALGEFIKRVKTNIDNEPNNFVNTGAISNINIEADGEVVNVMGNPWLIYQDRGVNGAKNKLYDTPHAYVDKMPPVQVFIDWIKSKKIKLKHNEKYSQKKPPFHELNTDEEIEKAAWAIAAKIYRDGFKPRHIYSREVPQLLTDLQNELAGFAIQQIKQNINVKESAQRIIIKP